jgi:TPR repeat protein
MYEKGEGVDKDYVKSFELYQQLAEKNYLEAQFSLALMYKDGRGTDKNHKKTLELSRKLAEKGHYNGTMLLGYCYDNGIGTSIDKRNAYKLFLKATLLNMALAFKNGESMENSCTKAFELFKAIGTGKDFNGITIMLGVLLS